MHIHKTPYDIMPESARYAEREREGGGGGGGEGE
jgi:hypothetical protein